MFGMNIRSSGVSESAVQDYLNSCGMWLDMYRGKYRYLGAGKTPLGLAATIAGEFARTAAVEAEIVVKGGDGAVRGVIDGIYPRLRPITELACAGGGAAFRCTYSRGRIMTGVFDASHFVPLCRDDNGDITSALFISEKTFDGKNHLLMEYHDREEEGWRIRRYCTEYPACALSAEFLLDPEGNHGSRLCRMPEGLGEPVTFLRGAEYPLFAYMPVNDGCFECGGFRAGGSVYSRAVGLIREADMQFNRLIWEYEGGELAVDVSEDMFRRTRRGLELPAGKERLFRTNLMSPSECEPMKVFSPALRDQSIANGLDIILSKIEDITGLSRGTVSALRYTDRTATEIRDSKQRLYVTVCDIQKGIRKALSDLALAARECGRLNGICGESLPEVSVLFGDSVVEDASAERVRDAQEFAAGLITREEFRSKWGL